MTRTTRMTWMTRMTHLGGTPLPLLAGLLAILASGCTPWRGPVDVRRDVHGATGAHYNRTFGLTVGPTAMAIARWGVRQGDDEDSEQVAALLAGLRKVEIGIWEVEEAGIGDPRRGIRAEDFPGWFPLVEATPEGEGAVLVLARGETPAAIRKMLVIVDDSEELVVIRMRGRLDTVIEEAIRYAFDEIDREELGDPVIDEYRETRDDEARSAPRDTRTSRAHPPPGESMRSR